ncbi:HAD-IB family hydrolase [Bacillus carboniphilus]|uniref:HAD-IB family hydrolase n=1 Tax=Bacillus carboniphilus TaxID=86663 RepID=A0ABY9JT01_9BACI|nr:HAD-IB family hydrolase [Bacillus carboniphilus]WLR41550.1 HAD-IB family hydrolase [Bacillus carboniphilus]
MNKITLFDLDKTLIKSDSMFLFLCYGIKKNPFTSFIIFPILVSTILYKLKFISAKKAKEYYYYPINYLQEEEIKTFYEQILKDKLYKEAVKELKRRKKEGYYNLVISASPYAYIKYFKEHPYIDDVIGTELYMHEGRYTNKILGNNCKGKEKVVRINKHLENKGLKINFEQSYAYSDSLSDSPMFSLVQNKYVINYRGKTNLQKKNWK